MSVAFEHADGYNIPHYVLACISIVQLLKGKAPLSLKSTLWKASLKRCETKVARHFVRGDMVA